MEKQRKKEIKEEFELQNDFEEDSEKRFDEDFERQKLYASEMNPEDQTQYKVMRLIPDSQTDFRGLVDKDIVLSNLKESKPSADEQKFVLGTIMMFREVFVKKEKVKFFDKVKKEVVEREVLVPDEVAETIIPILQADFKYVHVASRAMGDEREAKLDRAQYLEKNINRGQGAKQ